MNLVSIVLIALASVVIISVIRLVIILGLADPTRYESQAQLQAEAKIPKGQAEQIALALAPHANVRLSELEREEGVLCWKTTLEIHETDEVVEVQIDALTISRSTTQNARPVPAMSTLYPGEI